MNIKYYPLTLYHKYALALNYDSNHPTHVVSLPERGMLKKRQSVPNNSETTVSQAMTQETDSLICILLKLENITLQ